MKKYKVEVYYDQVEYYVVEAESEEEARGKVEEPGHIEFPDGLPDPIKKSDLAWEVQGAKEIRPPYNDHTEYHFL